ncbi:MAG: hypothetical protein HC767_15510 [Akkermansiaceae bacterium]|nr:hypothetical protein [Akkermansiaceae bacterium]
MLPMVKDIEHFYIEQGFIAGCLASQNGVPLDNQRYVTSWNGMWFWQKDNVEYSKVICRHFFGVVRHLMYLRGYPAFLKMQNAFKKA